MPRSMQPAALVTPTSRRRRCSPATATDQQTAEAAGTEDAANDDKFAHAAEPPKDNAPHKAHNHQKDARAEETPAIRLVSGMQDEDAGCSCHHK